MQNKGLIRLIAILLGLVCVYQLYFTYKAVKSRKRRCRFWFTQS